MDGSFKRGGEDISVAVLGQGVWMAVLSEGGEDISVAVLGWVADGSFQRGGF